MNLSQSFRMIYFGCQNSIISFKKKNIEKLKNIDYLSTKNTLRKREETNIKVFL